MTDCIIENNMAMTFGKMSMPLSKEQTTDGSKTAQSYHNYYKYEDADHPSAPSQIGHEHYTYDANGNPTQCGLYPNESQWRSFLCLLNNGASVNIINANGKTPLLIACGCDYFDTRYVKELIRSGADVNYTCPNTYVGRTGDSIPLLNAVRCRNLGMVKLLVEQKE